MPTPTPFKMPYVKKVNINDSWIVRYVNPIPDVIIMQPIKIMRTSLGRYFEQNKPIINEEIDRANDVPVRIQFEVE